MYSWHLTSKQTLKELIIEFGRFLTETCLRGQQQWECPKNNYLQHVQEKINKKYWPKEKGINNNKELGKVEAYRTKGS